jgi:hypothetical protein
LLRRRGVDIRPIAAKNARQLKCRHRAPISRLWRELFGQHRLEDEVISNIDAEANAGLGEDAACSVDLASAPKAQRTLIEP